MATQLVGRSARMACLLGTLTLAACGNSTSMTEDAGLADPDSATSSDAPSDGALSDEIPFLVGTNLSGAEFTSSAMPGTYGTNYIYPTHAEIDYFVGKGMRLFRIPFQWGRLQHSLGGPLDTLELARLKGVVDYALSKGARVLIDPHNYARYGGKVIGSDAAGAPTADQFADFWSKLATELKYDAGIYFGIMNEPNRMPTELWLSDANAAIAAIRSAGATNWIFVPGNGYTGAHSWMSNYYGTPNGTVMLGVVDPLDHYVYEVHQYLDSYSSGTEEACVSPTIGSERLARFTQWLADNGKRGFLGEFATADNPTCKEALEDMLDFIDAHRAQWIGWTWWTAGPWWGNYMYSIEPKEGQDKPQLATLLQHL